MKATFMLAAMLLVYNGCSDHQDSQLTQQQKDQIKNEIKAVGDSVLTRWQRLDVEGALKCYSPEMFAVGDSGIVDYQGYKTLWLTMPNAIGAVKWTTLQSQFVVLGKDDAMSAISGKLEMTTKSGLNLVVNPKLFTNLYKKVGDSWLITFEHGSGVTALQNPGKK